METTNTLIALIEESVLKAQREEVFYQEIFSNSNAPVGKNEFLFFIKPEITLSLETIELKEILNIIFNKISEFNFNIHDVKVLSAKYLEQYNIIAKHYGVINKISSSAVENLSEGATDKFHEIYGKAVTECKVLGGAEFLNQYPHFNAYSLDFLWQNIENKKLAGGTYCEAIKIDNETIHVINGFHPRQLKHFTEKGRSIITMTLSSDISWQDARNNFIGTTNPITAEIGSLRRTFLEKRSDLGLPEVSQGVNGVHLSAGPIEALVELERYNSNYSQESSVDSLAHYEFGKKLKKAFNQKELDRILQNSNLQVNNRSISIFDLTEEKDSDEVIEIIKTNI